MLLYLLPIVHNVGIRICKLCRKSQLWNHLPIHSEGKSAYLSKDFVFKIFTGVLSIMNGPTLFSQVGPYQSAVWRKISKCQDIHMWWDSRKRNKTRIRDQERVIDKKLEAWPRQTYKHISRYFIPHLCFYFSFVVWGV